MGLTQKELAELLKVAERTVQKWEGGETKVRQGTAFMIKSLYESRVKGAQENGKASNFVRLNDRAKEIGMNYSKVEVMTHLAQEYREYLNNEEFQRMVKLWAEKLNYTPELMKAIIELKEQLRDLSKAK